jgi:alkaline phosphatase D
MPQLNRRNFVAATAVSSMAVTLPVLGADPKPQEKKPEVSHPAPTKAIGPLLGHVEPTKAIVWYRPLVEGAVQLLVTTSGQSDGRTFTTTASKDHDLCVTWIVNDLKPGVEYQAQVISGSGKSAKPLGKPCVIRTPAPADQPARVSLALGSCASSTKFFEIWDQMAEQGADAVVLLGDTPYIDKTDFEANRTAHRQFLSIPSLGELVRTRPMWATWDDHDFGGNDSDGKQMAKHKAGFRQAFMEYRGLDSYGDGKEGIYTSFRYGPVEMFLLDPRYFSQCEDSPVDPQQKTCLGKVQWTWLLEKLKASTAPFKLIASGQIWDDKKNKEKDDWETYSGEREALFDFIGKQNISGVVLLSGDIHVSRRLRYPMKQRIGYDLEQWIVSPLHDRIIPSLNVPHPALLWGEAIPHVFLQVIADTTVSPATLTANWITSAGKTVHSVKLNETEMKPG